LQKHSGDHGCRVESFAKKSEATTGLLRFGCVDKDSVRSGQALLEDLHVPVEIVAPILRDLLESYGDSDCGNPAWPVRLPNESHGGFVGGASPLLPVAFHTTGYDVLPLCPAAAGFGDDMVISEILAGVLAPAVLALVPVSRIDILS